jgi:hypothetical protein
VVGLGIDGLKEIPSVEQAISNALRENVIESHEDVRGVSGSSPSGWSRHEDGMRGGDRGKRSGIAGIVGLDGVADFGLVGYSTCEFRWVGGAWIT